ncbi:MAG TPA: TonB-dependent receptor [Bacteroidales bacterium]|nr:TonB-dependent receptor [Bacteroidales bacterium]
MVNRRIYSLIYCIPIALVLNAQEKYPVSGDYQGMTFIEFVSANEKILPVKFFFREEWVRDLRIGNHSGCADLSCILDKVFSGTTLHYLIEESGNIVITNNYAVRIFEKPKDPEKPYLAPGKDENLNESLNPEIETIEIGNRSARFQPGRVNLSGYITDQDTKEPIAGATVYNGKLAVGTMANEYGFYSLSLPRGNHLIQLKSIGMKDKQIIVNLNSEGEMNVEMKSEVIPLKAVVVTSEKSITLQRFEVGAERINIRSFKLLPTTMGELDILKSILLVPGVKSVGEASAGFNVRGGSADQNLIFLYGAPIYNSTHFFGFFSAINSDIIRDVTLYKGGIPARYGGRISSVLDIGTREGNRKEFGGNAGISPVTTHLMVEGPIIKDTLTYIFTARTTYANWILRLLTDPELQKSKASYFDLNGKLNYDINKNNKLELSGYYSHDDFRFNFDSLYRYNNHIIAIKWRHFFNSAFFTSVSANNSLYEYSLSSDENLREAFSLSHKLNSTNFRTDFNWFAGKHEINFGFDLNNYILNPGVFNPKGDSSNVVHRALEKERALESALYLDDKIAINEFLSVQGGLRLSGFFTFGPQSVMVYNPELPKSKSTITDTIKFRSNDLISKYGAPEFRFSLNFRISDKRSFKINYNRTRQYLHLLSNSSAISPLDVWKLSDSYLMPQTGDQISAGYYEILKNKHAEFSVEIYYKKIRNMIDFKGGANIIMNENIEKDIVPVRGKAYGMELTLKKSEGKLNYSLGYTYARVFQRTISEFPAEQINSGHWFPANFDRPHDLSVTCNYLFSRRISFSGNFILSSGRPVTFPVASYIIYDNRVVHYSDRNKYRIPNYSRLDLSITINGNLRSNKIAHPRWTFSVYNVLARKNVYSVYFKRDGNAIKGYKLSIFGRAIPSVTYSFDF